ncbi:MAG: hypothetical protein HY666_02845 [Chloroflexi bacterium]|nr:hypothetical protein [Chloroflexota bacterium]
MLIVLLTALLWITDTVPLPNILPNIVSTALKNVMNYIAKGFGDASAYMEDPAKRDAIRQITEDILEQYQANGNCSEVIVFAHSQGTVIAFDVLSHNPQLTKCKTLMTIGSILSPIHKMYSKDKHKVFEKPLNKPLRWLFFYARFDPGPAGPLSAEFKSQALAPAVKLEQILVDNRDTITEDHVTYSLNWGQVISRLLDEMFGPTVHHNPYYRDRRQRQIDFNERRRRVARLALWRTVTYFSLISVFGFFVGASLVSAIPATSMLNWLITKPIVGQSVKSLYRLPSAEDGSIKFVAGKRLVLQNGVLKLDPHRKSFVVDVVDRNDTPKIVPRHLDRTPQEPSPSGSLTYTTHESSLHTGVGNFVFWQPVFKHVVLPAFFTILFAIFLLIAFRFYRDILWKRSYESWHEKRHDEYKRWRETQP